MSKILAYGEIMLRLSTQSNIADSDRFDACYGGTEANVLACLHALGHQVKYLSALPDTQLGQAVLNHLHGYGVETTDVKVCGDTLGIYFAENGNASRGSNVEYLRRHSEFTRLCAEDVDFDRLFDGVDMFHVSGISFALSDCSRELGFRLLDEARKRGAAISFDFNYRSKLWSVDDARKQLVKAAGAADILLASTLDLETFLRLTPREVFDNYPNCRYLAVRDRKALTSDKHSVSVSLYARDGRAFTLAETPFAVLEKIGGGDAFNGCLLHSLSQGWDIKRATLFASAGFILKHQQRGDTFAANADEIAEFAATLYQTR